MIVNPVLPPKRGYVEVVVDGKHTYRNAETGVLIENEVPDVPDEQDVSWEAMANAISEGVNEV